MTDIFNSIYSFVGDPFTNDTGKYITGTTTKSSYVDPDVGYIVPNIPYPWEYPWDTPHYTPFWQNTGTTLNIKMEPPEIKDVIFNPPATIVLWKDGTKTVVKCQSGDTYSKETGLALAICKKVYGNTGTFNDVFNRWLK